MDPGNGQVDLPIVAECRSSTQIATAAAVFIVWRCNSVAISSHPTWSHGTWAGGLEWLDFGETPVPALRRRFARRRRPNGHHPTVYNDQRSATMIYRDRKEIKNDWRTTTTTTMIIITILNESVIIGRRDDKRR